MDTELAAAESQLRLASKILHVRQMRLAKTTTRMSRHYNKVKHTDAMISLLEELRGFVLQDPDYWDEEPDLVPF